jgi:hypothetical protein
MHRYVYIVERCGIDVERGGLEGPTCDPITHGVFLAEQCLKIDWQNIWDYIHIEKWVLGASQWMKHQKFDTAAPDFEAKLKDFLDE